MCMVDVELLYEHWRIHPPADELIAAYLGYKPPPKPFEPSSEGPPAEIIQLMDFARRHVAGGAKVKEARGL